MKQRYFSKSVQELVLKFASVQRLVLFLRGIELMRALMRNKEQAMIMSNAWEGLLTIVMDRPEIGGNPH